MLSGFSCMHAHRMVYEAAAKAAALHGRSIDLEEDDAETALAGSASSAGGGAYPEGAFPDAVPTSPKWAAPMTPPIPPLMPLIPKSGPPTPGAAASPQTPQPPEPTPFSKQVVHRSERGLWCARACVFKESCG